MSEQEFGGRIGKTIQSGFVSIGLSLGKYTCVSICGATVSS